MGTTEPRAGQTDATGRCENAENGKHIPGTREVKQPEGAKPIGVTFCKNCGLDLV